MDEIYVIGSSYHWPSSYGYVRTKEEAEKIVNELKLLRGEDDCDKFEIYYQVLRPYDKEHHRDLKKEVRRFSKKEEWQR
jgi:hypothetical protein